MPSPLLLTTKFYFPSARQNLVPRPRLVKQLHEGFQGPLTLISAPAGYGKTTLMSEWRTGIGRDVPAAWLSLDKDDNDPSRFLTYLVAALGTIKTTLGESAVSLLQSSQSSPAQTILTSLINEIVELGTQFLLVLDDYHTITTQPVHDILTYILDHQPPQMHLVILTRVDPPLPLARMRACRHLAELRVADLRFTTEEIASFFGQVMGLSLAVDEIKTLEQRTEGWIVGLQLAGLSFQGHEHPSDIIANFSGGDHYILDYLVEEVLNRQAESLRIFLLQTSILDRLTGRLCDALTGRADGQATLEALEHANLFVSPLDSYRQWYRYHPLFADILRNRQRLIDADKLLELHRRSAKWHEQNGFTEDAIHYALAGEDLEYAALLLEQNAWPMVMGGEIMKLANCIQALRDILPEHPWLNIYQAWVLLLSNQLERMEEHLRMAEQIMAATALAERSELQNMQGHIATIRAFASSVFHDDPTGVSLANRALESLPANNLTLRSVVLFVLGGAFNYRGDIDQSLRAFEEAARVGRNSGNLLMAVHSLCLLAEMQANQGKLRHAMKIIQEATELASEKPRRYHLGIAKVYLTAGVLEYELNELESAEEHANKSLELGQLLGIADYTLGGKIFMARLSRVRGNRDRARDLLHEADQYAIRTTMGPSMLASLSSNWMRLYLDDGDLETAQKIAQERGLNLSMSIAAPRWFEYCAYTRLVLAQGSPDASIELAGRLLDFAETTGLGGCVIKAQALKALGLEAKGDLPAALAALEKALKMAKPEGYIRTILDEGEAMAKLLRHAKTKGIEIQYVTRLLIEYSKYSIATIPAIQSLIEPLSKRELEVLRLIAIGCSNKEIASQLFITISTVKRHTVTIFQKLDVQNRTQAVAVARELELL